MKKKTKPTIKDDYEVLINVFANEIRKEQASIWKRCALEGCRYGYQPMDKEPADKCMYCGEPRNYYFDNLGPVKSIQKTLKKLKKVRVKIL